MLEQFKDFIMKGNLVALAVAFIIAGAFGAVVVSFTDDIIMQIVAAIVGEPDFSGLTFDLGDAKIGYGNFLTAVINFLIIAAVLFVVVKAYEAWKGTEEEGPSEIDLLTEIRDSLAK
ncbi:MAG: large conductance mechanosensitive channel protein MscL [Acidimicrobiia bacterium]|nr:large conductance mechanosensitive channel protein MscL [Acidimicrobiia bacterium]MDH5236747.1 large conductance mechanosensitive channel protein MscL [Acidimicrobiia bacterium]